MRVLVADDEHDMARALEAMLKRDGYEVDVVHDGQAALDFGGTGTYDCLVLDLMMPKRDGRDVVRTLRRRGMRTPILILTAKSEQEDLVSGLNSGADDYLTKPFAMAEFLARVRALCRRSDTYVPDTLTAGDLELDRSAFTVSCRGTSTRLTNKEFQMLELLMRQPGRYVAADRLREHVWGFDGTIENNVLWTYVSYLRRKLESVGSRSKIVASRGRGYALEVDEPRSANGPTATNEPAIAHEQTDANEHTAAGTSAHATANAATHATADAPTLTTADAPAHGRTMGA